MREYENRMLIVFVYEDSASFFAHCVVTSAFDNLLSHLKYLKVCRYPTCTDHHMFIGHDMQRQEAKSSSANTS